MIAYKAFDKNLKCRDFQFEIGKKYEHKGKLEICSSGFHACEKLSDCFSYYQFNSSDTRICEVEIVGQMLKHDSDSKICTDIIKINRELTWEEVLKLCNSGDYNSGHSNSGDYNSGDYNSGSWNRGDWNSGDSNSGDRNSGNYNSGDGNNGSCNSGDRNSGDCNSGYGNIGSYNSGDYNSGSWNRGDWNSGDSNSGYGNSGNYNSGDYNSGSWNRGDWNSGIFNTNLPDKVRVFNKFISRKKYESIQFPDFIYFSLNIWVSHDTATEEEKKKYKTEIEICGGFLKTLPYKEAFKLSWDKADKTNRMLITKIPGFDKDLFFEISGINVDE